MWLSFGGRCCVGLPDRQREKGREKRKMGEKREKLIFFYIICYYNLYYFNELYVKIGLGMLGEL